MLALQHLVSKEIRVLFLNLYCPSSLYLTTTLEKQGFMLDTHNLKGVSVVVGEGLESITSLMSTHLLEELEAFQEA